MDSDFKSTKKKSNHQNVSTEDSIANESDRPRRKPKYFQPHRNQRSRLFTSLENPPTTSVSFRSSLDLDNRFFPSGIQPGHFVEVKGPENSGKTFLLTYFIAQFLLKYLTKTAVLIDTSHQFNLRNLFCILMNEDKEIQFNREDTSLTLSKILEMNPKLNNYLDRLFVIKCYSAEEFIITISPDNSSSSVLHKMIKSDHNLSLVAIDTVDNYSFVEGYNSEDGSKNPNIMKYIFNSVGSLRTPVICTTIMRSDFYISKNVKATKTDEKNSGSSNEQVESKAWYSNVHIEPSFFTHSLAIAPLTAAEKANVPKYFKNAYCGKAYLRSKHNANIAGSANHRVKFSIFSDILRVIENMDESRDAPNK